MALELYFPPSTEKNLPWLVAYGYNDADDRVVVGGELFDGVDPVVSASATDASRAWAIYFDLPSGFTRADKLRIYYQKANGTDQRQTDFAVNLRGAVYTASATVLVPSMACDIPAKNFISTGVVDPLTGVLSINRLHIPAAFTIRMPHQVTRIGERFIITFKQLDMHNNKVSHLEVAVVGQTPSTFIQNLTIKTAFVRP